MAPLGSIHLGNDKPMDPKKRMSTDGISQGKDLLFSEEKKKYSSDQHEEAKSSPAPCLYSLVSLSSLLHP